MLKILAGIGVIQVIAILVSIIRSKTMAVLLGPEGVGVIGVVDNAVLLVMRISALSLPFAAVKFLSRSHSKDHDAFNNTYSSILKTLAVLTSIGALIGLVIVIWFPDKLGSELHDYRLLMIPALLAVPANTFHGFISQVFAAARMPRTSGLFILLIAVLLTVASAVGIIVAGTWGYYWATFLASGAIAGAGILYLRGKLKLQTLRGRHSIFRELRANPDIVTFTLILYAAGFTQPISLLIARYAVLTRYGEAEAGFMQAAIGLSAALNSILNPLNGLYLTPIVNRDIPKNEKLKEATRFQGRLIFITLAMAMPMVLFSQWLVVLQYSPAFGEVSRTLFLFVVTQCMIQFAGVFQALIIGLDDLKIYAVSLGAGQLLLGIIAWLLTPVLGLHGVAVGFLVSNLAILLLTWAQLALRHGLRLPRRLIFSMCYGLIALFVLGKISFYDLDASDPLVIVFKVAVYGLFLTSLLFLLSEEDLTKLRGYGASILARRAEEGWLQTAGYAYRRLIRGFFT
jgi:PST family polysaccharide transporter